MARQADSPLYRSKRTATRADFEAMRLEYLAGEALRQGRNFQYGPPADCQCPRCREPGNDSTPAH